jgi:hypothetical protein
VHSDQCNNPNKDHWHVIKESRNVDKHARKLYASRMPTPNTTVDQLKRAIVVAEQIEKLKAELAAILGGTSTVQAEPAKVTSASPVKGRKRRKLSPESRARIVAAVKARWARVKGQKGPGRPAKAPKATKRKRNLTPEGRARLAASMKARWAARKAGQAA